MRRNIHRCLLLSLVTLTDSAEISDAIYSSPEITAPPNYNPNFVRRQEDIPSNFIGYTQFEGRWEPEFCGHGSTVLFSSSWAACDPTTEHAAAPLATTCFGESVLIAPNTEYRCRSVCYTISIFQSVGDNAPHTAYACDSVSRDVSFYVTTPVTSSSSLLTIPGTSTRETTSTTSSSSRSPRPVSSLSLSFSTTRLVTSQTQSRISQTQTTVTSTTSSGNSSGSDVNKDPDPTSTHLSPGVIAGVVIGSIAVVGIIGLLAWILVILRRRGRTLPSPPEPIQNQQPEPIQD
ncbi:hypothetical protein H072_1292 [Dactylellina haptotyla CBS 200.50]|uniref:Mid2 domain-containing protein n=1 Tax=Dactylellina haptotyla (strain CBS 200.50) TaxID=1284197 RepID=S8CAF0_DACHA|nr:hypothetical protein H072_1292 [Dactylellina haptotyla CBS 200.50]